MNHTMSRDDLTATSRHERRHELDWLRVLAVFGLIPFHVAIIFTAGKDYVQNAQRSALLAALAAFVSFWGIPLLFLVAGASAWFALGTRSPCAFVVERLKRLLVPFLFGVLAIVPIQVYFGRLTNPGFRQSYLEFYPRFLAAFTIANAAEYWAHLWFVPALLLFSALTVPLFFALKSERGQQFVARLGALSARPGAVLLFGIPLGLSDLILRSKPVITLAATYLRYTEWALIIFFLLFYLYGYLLYADQRFVQAARRDGPVAAVLGIICWIVAQRLVGSYTGSGYAVSVEYVAAMLFRGFISWFWVVAIVSLALRWLTFTNRTLRYLDDAFYPAYVLHMPVLTIIGFYVVRWPVGIWVKFPVIIVATLVVTLLLYELLIRRLNLTRYLFGLKPKSVAGQSQTASDGSAAQPVAPARRARPRRG